MASTASRKNIAHHVFKRHYANLGSGLQLHLPLVVSELYSSSLISPGTKDKVLSDAPTPSHSRALTVLNDVEGRLKTDCVIFEKFLDILCHQNVGLSHLAEPMRLDYQRLCEGSSHLDSTDESNEGHKSESCLAGAVDESFAPGMSLSDPVRRMEDLHLYHDETPKEARPKDLQFMKFPELVEDQELGKVTQEVTSSKAFSCVDQGLKHAPLTLQRKAVPCLIDTPNQDPHEVELLGEAMGAVQRFFISVQESRDQKVEKTRKECEEKMSAVKVYYEVQCDSLKTEMEHADKAHEVEVTHLKHKYDRDTESLMNTVQLFTTRSVIQEQKLAELSKELSDIHEQFSLKSQEVDQLRVALAEREAELNDIKKIMDTKEYELKQMKSDVKPSLKSYTVMRKMELQTKVSALEEIQGLVSQCSKCHPDNLGKLKRDLAKKIERLTAVKRRRSLSLP